MDKKIFNLNEVLNIITALQLSWGENDKLSYTKYKAMCEAAALAKIKIRERAKELA